MDQKICRACGSTKNLSDFRRNSETADGYRYKCKECDRLKRPVNPEISKAMRFPTRQYSTRKSREGLDQIQAKRAQKYGLTVAELDNMLVKQSGLCAICENPLNAKYCVDHCHKTGKTRGLLCYSCNSGIGLLQDDPNILQAAIDYLSPIV